MEVVRRLADADSPCLAGQDTHLPAMLKRQLPDFSVGYGRCPHNPRPVLVHHVYAAVQVLGPVLVVCDTDVVIARGVGGLYVATQLASQ